MEKFGSKFGTGFQTKILSALLSDMVFSRQIFDILKPQYFDSEASEWLCKTILTYIDTYESKPTLDVLKTKIAPIERDILKSSVIDTLKQVWRDLESDDLDYVKEETLNFCTNQSLKQAILESIPLLEQGKYDKIKSTIDTAMKAGQPTDVGHEYKTMLNSRYEDLARNPVSTGWDVIDEITQGGFGMGELIIFAAPPGIGKSWSLVNVAASAIKSGKIVVYYTLELSEAMVGQRFDSVFTGIPIPNLKYNMEEVERIISSLKGDLIIKGFNTGAAGINALKAHIDRMILQNKKPDVIVVDYADLLKGSAKEKRHEVLEELVVDLRGMAGEYGVPLYTASQINRCHNVNDMVETPHGFIKIGELKVGDCVMTHLGYRAVTNVFPIEKQPTYKIKLKDGKEINVSAEHILPTQYGKLKSIASGLKVGDKLFVKK
jgi:hypothetical protein